MYIRLYFILLFLSAMLNAQLSKAADPSRLIPVQLKCELRVNPQGIDISNPGLSFILKCNNYYAKNQRQSAFMIWVSSSKDFKNGGDLWNSGKITSDKMAYISYAGKPLISGQKYWWKVRVWDQDGQPSAWSQPANWTTGIINPAEWKAKWISASGASQYALSPVGYLSKQNTSPNERKWVQIDLGKPIQFSEICLYPSFFNDRAAYGFPIRFQILSSNDPDFKTNTIIADETGKDFEAAGYAPSHFYAKNTTGRYIRLLVTKTPRNGFSLRQITILSQGKNIAAGKAVAAFDSNEAAGFTKQSLTDQPEDYNAIPNYSSMMLRKDFSVKPALIHAVIHISGLSEYELTINGQKIGNYLLTPGWTDYRKTVLYDTYDVLSQLKTGNNAIGIILGNSVYNIQPDTARYVKFITTFGPAKAIAQLTLTYADGSVKTIGTDGSWQVAPGPITYSNLYGGEDYNANLEPKGWNTPYFNATNWQHAIETAGPGGVLKGLSSSAPPISAIETKSPVKIIKIKNNLYIYDFGQNAAMMPSLTVSGNKGAYVRMIPAELLGKNGLADRASATQSGIRPAWWQYTLNGAKAEKWFPKFFYQGARYLQVELYPAKAGGALPQITTLNDVIVHSTSTPVGSFECANPLFNKIYSLVRWAQRSNMMSLMTDCPHREKMGWLEENQLNGPSLRYNFDMAPLFRKTMSDMADAQLSNGLIPNIAPEYFIAGSPEMANGFRNSPEWGSSFIIVPWQQYLFSGDISLLQRYYDRMKVYMNFLDTEAQNKIIYTGLGDWYDIGPKEPWGSQLTPVSFTATAIYYYDSWIMYNIAKVLGKTEDAGIFKQSLTQIRDAFNKAFYHPETGLYATGSQTTCAMPLFFNLVEPENRQRLLDALVAGIRKHNNSFTSGEVGYRFLLKALAEGGASGVVYDMNNQSDKPGYGYQIKMGATSLTEKWDAGVGNFGSQNHFMSGQINEWFFNDLVGLGPDETGAGFKKFIIKPAFLADLNWVKGSYQSISGTIACQWQKTGKRISLTVTVPVNTSATVCLPLSATEVAIKSMKSQKGLKKSSTGIIVNQLRQFNVGSGVYKFDAVVSE